MRTDFANSTVEIMPRNNPIKISYSEAVIGDAEKATVIIACHGFTSSKDPLVDTFFREFIKHTEKWGGDYRIIAFDWPGHGDSGEAVQYSLHFYRVCLFSFMDALGIEKAHIYGMSMGAIVGIIFSALHPERVLSLAPQGPPVDAADIRPVLRAAGAAAAFPVLLLRKYLPHSLEFIPEKAMKKLAIAGIRMNFGRKAKSLKGFTNNDGLVDAWIRDLRKLSLPAFYDLGLDFLNLGPGDYLKTLASHDLPILIFDGENAEYVFVDTLPKLEKALAGPKTRVCRISNTGHLASVLRPDEAALYFYLFLDEVQNAYVQDRLQKGGKP